MDNKTKIIINYIIEKQIDKLDEEHQALDEAAATLSQVPDTEENKVNNEPPSYFIAVMKCSAEEIRRAMDALYEIQDMIQKDKHDCPTNNVAPF